MVGVVSSIPSGGNFIFAVFETPLCQIYSKMPEMSDLCHLGKMYIPNHLFWTQELSSIAICWMKGTPNNRKFTPNKKVLLCECKRHTAHSIASDCFADQSPDGGVPHPILDLGVPQGTPHPDLGLGTPCQQDGVPPIWNWDGAPPPPVWT